MAIGDEIPRGTAAGINARVSLITHAMDRFVLLCVLGAIVYLSARGDMDKATTGSLLGIVLGAIGHSAVTSLRSRTTDTSSQSSGD